MKYSPVSAGQISPDAKGENISLPVMSTSEHVVHDYALSAGFTQDTRKIRTKRGQLKNINKISSVSKSGFRFCDLVNTHTMRRTAITTMLFLGMPEHVVRKISGHSPISKEFFRYVSLAQAYHDKGTEIVFNKLKEKKMSMG